MSDSEDSEDQFNFTSKDNFDDQQKEKETMLSNDQHYNLLTQICNNFYNNLENHDDFNHKLSWRTYSNLEPIKIEINSSETFPGICDLLKSNNKFYTKVLTAIITDIYQIENILPNMGYTQYESLYPLSIYGETVEGAQQVLDSNEETRISHMLPHLNYLYIQVISQISNIIQKNLNLIHLIYLLNI